MIVKMIHGSHLYGLDTPTSDKDYKGIFMPSLNDLLLEKNEKHRKESTGDQHSKNTSDDVDVELFSLRYFIDLACNGETAVLDMLHSSPRHWIESSPIWEDLYKNRSMFYTKNMSGLIGYARRQAAKYGIKGSRINVIKQILDLLSDEYPTTILKDVKLPKTEYSDWVTQETPLSGTLTFYEVCGRKFQSTLQVFQITGLLEKLLKSYGDRAIQAASNAGIDWKAVSHALRAAYQMREILLNSGFEYPLKETQFILDVKQGKLDFLTEVRPVLESLIEEVEQLSKESNYPEKSDRKFWDDWLLNVYKENLLK